MQMTLRDDLFVPLLEIKTDVGYERRSEPPNVKTMYIQRMSPNNGPAPWSFSARLDFSPHTSKGHMLALTSTSGLPKEGLTRSRSK